MPVRRYAAIAAAVVLRTLTVSAQAHAIAGMRVFPGTLTFPDPGVTDEFDLGFGRAALSTTPGGPSPYVSTTSATESKTITKDLAFSIGGSYQGASGNAGPSGFGNAAVGLSYLLWKSDSQETLITGALNESLNDTGSAGVGEPYSVFSPTLLFGRGLGDLPSKIRLLRPFAITGMVAANIPSAANVARSVSWGVSVQYSLPYLQSYVRDIGLHAPFNNLVPLVEIPMQTYTSGPYAGQTLGTIDPGFVWIGHYGQVGIEATIPVNRASGRGLGVILGVGFYLDDLFPHSLGAPLFPATPRTT
ncbi:MAG: hypothetical protein ACYCXX_14545 [Acidiferrobacter thiooxydans]|jgi:hypothetical protein